MRDNIEQASAFKVRHTAPQYSTLTATLTASYTIAADSPNVLFLDGGLSARDVYLPAIVPGGGQEIKILNTGTVDLTIRDAGGVSILVLQTAESGEFISKPDSWASIKYGTPLTIGVDVQAYSARLTELANISWAQGDIVYYNGLSLVKLAAGTSGHFLKTQGPGANPLWAAVAGAALADGDYGDIVVSSSGTVMSIDSGVLTAAGRALVDDADAATQRTTLGLGTADNPQFATIELGHASDTTISRSSAGVISVEGVTVPLNSTSAIHTAQQIELGHASDTTLTRSSAGVLAVEGVTVPLNSTTDTHIAQQIELGHPSDTTVSRSSAGVLAVEGVTVPLNSITNTHTAQQIELGHATDTTFTRVSAGVAAIEGNNILTTATGLGQGKYKVWIPSDIMRPRVTNGPSVGVNEMTTNKNNFLSLDYDTTTQEFAQFDVCFGNSWNKGTVTFQPVWSHAATATNFGVVWALQAVAISDTDTMDVAFGTEQTSTDTGGTTNTRYIGPESAAITIAGSPANGDQILFQVKRNPSDGSDTLAIDARLRGIWLFFTVNAATDA